jgi:enoyl-CoA hydratase/carnithine racemase
MLVVVKLNRLARSIRDLLALLDQIKAAGARFRALDDPWCDTTTILGANGSVFCSGHDFADMINRDLDGMRQLLATCTELMLTIRRLPQPVVAKVQGIATAAGCPLRSARAGGMLATD